MDNQQEIWKPWKRFLIPWTTEAMFHVSNLWRLRSHKTSKSYIIENIHPQTSWYFIYQFRLFGKRHSYLIHRIVMEVFKWKPKDWFQVNHIDGIKANNTLENLEYVTHKDNIKHAWKTWLVRAKKWKDCYLYKKTWKDHPKSKEIHQQKMWFKWRETIKVWQSANLAAQHFNWNRSHISRAAKKWWVAYWWLWLLPSNPTKSWIQ
jgi:hypothetical protein